MSIEELKKFTGFLIMLVGLFGGIILIMYAQNYLTTKEIVSSIFSVGLPISVALIVFGWKYAFSK